MSFAPFRGYRGPTLRLHRESGDASVLAATAQVLGVSAAAVAALFGEAGE